MTLKDFNQEKDEESLKKHTDEIELNEKYLSLIYDTLSEMIFLLAVEPDDCYRFMSVNQAFLAATGLTREQVVGKRIELVLPETAQAVVISKYKEAIVENKTVSWEQAFAYPTSESVGAVTVTPVRNAEGVCTHLVGTVHDLTERKQAEEELRLHAVMMDNVVEGIYMIGLDDLTIKWTNEKFERMFGYDPGEMVGKQVDIVNAPIEKTPAETRISIVEVLKETGEWHGEVRTIKRDGTHFWCYANVSTFDHPEYGEVILSVHTDITERKKVEEALQEKETGYNVLFDNANDLIQKVGPDGKILLVNKKWLETLEYSEEGVKDLQVTDIIREDQIAHTMGLLQGVAKGENVSGFETIFITKNGKEIYVEGNGNGIFKDGKFISTIGIFRDITERKKADEALCKAHENTNTILENAPFGVVVIGRDRKIKRVNDTALKMAGIENADIMLGKNCGEYLCPAQQKECPILDEGQQVDNSERIFRRKDGKEIPIIKTVTEVNMDGEDVLLETFVDNTERKRAEEEIKKFNEELEQRVKDRTADLEKRNKDLDIMNKGFVGRELRMVELKKQIAELEKDAEADKNIGGKTL